MTENLNGNTYPPPHTTTPLHKYSHLKIDSETQDEFELFLEFLNPECAPLPARYLSKLKCSSISIENLKELSERNRWVKRAIDFDIEIIKSRNAKHIDASDVVSNALIKLAGNTLADAAHRPSSNKDAIEKALKLISGYKKLK